MSEIPKLKLCESVFVENIGNKDEINFVVNNHNKEDIITLSSLKEVNAFWDKYHNNAILFINDFPIYIKELVDLNIILKISKKEYIWLEPYTMEFYNWLHDYLYKVE